MISDKHNKILKSLMLENTERLSILKNVRSLDLPDCWIGAGFVRNAVWDYLHNIHTSFEFYDIDVIYFNPNVTDQKTDIILEDKLRSLEPNYNWSVKNQAHMHKVNKDKKYISCLDSISKWPETTTSIAIRLTSRNELEVIAPFGVEDIFQMIVRPTPHFLNTNKQYIVIERISKKRWLERWPNLNIVI